MNTLYEKGRDTAGHYSYPGTHTLCMSPVRKTNTEVAHVNKRIGLQNNIKEYLQV